MHIASAISIGSTISVGGAINPILQLSPFAWYDASEIEQADNTAVSTWVDLSGNGYDATQAVSASRPTYRTNQINGKSGVVFDGSNDFLPMPSNSLGVFRNIAGLTVFIVGKYSAINTNQALFFASSGTSTTANRFLIRTTTNTQYQVNGRRLDANSAQLVNSIQSATTNFIIHTGRIDFQNTLLQQYIDGTLDGEKIDFQTAGNTSDTDSLVIRIGNISSTYLNGTIAEIIIFNRALTNEELLIAHQYLKQKYNL